MHMQSTTINPAPRFPESQNVAQATMSSREIAELTGKQHKNVIRDIREMLEALVKDGSDVSHALMDLDSRGYTSNIHLNRELTETLITGYSIPLRHRVIRRLHELEGRTIGTIATPQSLPEALRLAADLAEQIAEQAPKVAALERLQGAAGTLCLTDAAKHLGISRHRLMDWLQQNRWMYRRAGTRPWIAYQPRLEAGLVKNKVTVIGTTDEGDERCASQFRITAKGLSVLAQKIAQGVL
ncbi:DNA-binding protein [Pseudomonas sp. BN414]|nr:DNA-binding protein [Pseudomonas sp. BN414]